MLGSFTAVRSNGMAVDSSTSSNVVGLGDGEGFDVGAAANEFGSADIEVLSAFEPGPPNAAFAPEPTNISTKAIPRAPHAAPRERTRKSFAEPRTMP